MLTTVTFTSESEDRTRVTVFTEVYGVTTEAELDLFKNERGGAA